MVTNSFGDRNFMQPVRKLTKCLNLFSFKFWVGGRFFFSFFFCFQHVSLKFPMGSHQVLNLFPMFPMCSSRVFPIALSFNPICLPKVLPFSPICGPKPDAIHLSMESSILGRLKLACL